MRWMFPKTKRDQEIRMQPLELPESETSGLFNVSLAENDGGVALVEPRCKTLASPGQHEADDDIRADRIKRFDDPEDLIASLKQPW